MSEIITDDDSVDKFELKAEIAELDKLYNLFEARLTEARNFMAVARPKIEAIEELATRSQSLPGIAPRGVILPENLLIVMQMCKLYGYWESAEQIAEEMIAWLYLQREQAKLDLQELERMEIAQSQTALSEWDQLLSFWPGEAVENDSWEVLNSSELGLADSALRDQCSVVDQAFCPVADCQDSLLCEFSNHTCNQNHISSPVPCDLSCMDVTK